MGHKPYPILAYHKIDHRFEWGITRVTPKQFEAQLEFLNEMGYRTMSLAQIQQQNRLIQSDRKLVITFDDAYQSIYEHAFPILSRFNFTATVFVITHFVGKLNRWDLNLGGIRFQHLNWTQLRELVDAGWQIGSHSINHPDVINCTDSELWNEVHASKLEIEHRTGVPVHYFSYPFGRYNQRVIQFVEKAGYHAACTLRYFSPDIRKEPYRIGRQSVYWWDSIHSFNRKLRAGPATCIEAIKQKAVTFCSRGTVFLKNLEKKPCNFS